MWSLNSFRFVENDEIEDIGELIPTLIHQSAVRKAHKLFFLLGKATIFLFLGVHVTAKVH